MSNDHTAAAELLIDGFGRVRDLVHDVLSGIDEDTLTARLDPDANSIAWLVWHACRVQDDHVADAAGAAQVWTDQGWAERFGLPFDEGAIGYGQSSDEVGQVRASAELLAAYADAVCARSVDFVSGLSDEDLARVVDERWDPPVTMSVRLVSVLSDDLQHLGQAAYARGIIARL